MLPKSVRRKLNKLGTWVIVDFSEEAKNRAVGFNFNKKIIWMYNGYITHIENYSDIKLQDIIKNGIPVIDRTRGQLIPKESRFIPDISHALGRLQVTKIVY